MLRPVLSDGLPMLFARRLECATARAKVHQWLFVSRMNYVTVGVCLSEEQFDSESSVMEFLVNRMAVVRFGSEFRVQSWSKQRVSRATG